MCQVVPNEIKLVIQDIVLRWSFHMFLCFLHFNKLKLNIFSLYSVFSLFKGGEPCFSITKCSYLLSQWFLLLKINTWGYSTINFFAPMSRYASAGGGPLKASHEFKEMVKALHGAGIEVNLFLFSHFLTRKVPVIAEVKFSSSVQVILDVVYNHTNEADDAYPYTTSFRGIDNKVMSHFCYENFSLSILVV